MFDRNEIANTYLTMPESYNSETLQAWEHLRRESVEHAKLLRSMLTIEYVESDEPYHKAREMFADLENHRFQVSVNNCEHPLWTPESNIEFRIAHDVLGHWKMGTTHSVFNFKGETQAYRSQCRYLRSPEAKRALLTEVIGQAAYRGTFGEFPEQKIAFVR